jgi:hypothetical protein
MPKFFANPAKAACDRRHRQEEIDVERMGAFEGEDPVLVIPA